MHQIPPGRARAPFEQQVIHLPHWRADVKRNRNLARALTTTVLALATSAAFAQPTQPGRAPVTEPEIRYQAGGSPLATEEMHQNINPKAPPMTKAEFDKGQI